MNSNPTPKKSPMTTIVITALMLFSMFFGAGNLILPPLLGLQAGDQAIPAMTGFLKRALSMPAK